MHGPVPTQPQHRLSAPVVDSALTRRPSLPGFGGRPAPQAAIQPTHAAPRVLAAQPRVMEDRRVIEERRRKVSCYSI